MTSHDEPDDFGHLPNADAEEEERRAKADLWRQIAEQHRSPAEEEPSSEDEPARDSSYHEKADLFRRIAEQHKAGADPDSSGEPSASPEPEPEVEASPPPSVHEPERPSSSGGESAMDGKAMWEAFLKESGESSPTTESSPVSPSKESLRRETPPIHLGEEGNDEPESRESSEEETETSPGASDEGKKGSEDEVAEPADNRWILAADRKRAWIVAGAFHLLVIIVMAIVRVVPMPTKLGEITAISAAEEVETPSWKKVTTAMPKAAMLQPTIAPIMAQATSNFAMPDVDLTPTANELNVGTSMGTFGTGTSKGGFGNVSFLGNKASGQYIVFVVDVSGSMSATSRVGNSAPISRFELLKRELNKSLAQIGGGTRYQVLYFSDFAWPHNEVDSNDYNQLNSYAWLIKPGDRNPEIPRFQYLVASAPTLRKSREIIRDSNNPGGTNWGAGLLMALNANPRPDVIFFMTDGSGGNAEKWVDEVTRANGRGKRSIIHTTAMMEPQTAEPLADLARRNGGNFTVVLANGAVIKGDDYFSGRRD
jgi:hypothetical protein